jgi:hypothetical protein
VTLTYVPTLSQACVLQRTFCSQLDSAGSGWGSVAGYCEDSNELSGFIKGGEFLDRLSDHQLLKEDSDPLN